MKPHHRTTALVFGLVAVVFAVFFNTLEAGFLRWDDDINVFENPHVQGLTAENLRWMFTDFEQAIRYKPLAWLAWGVVHELFGLNPFGFHLANVLLHSVNTVLVFLLIRRLLKLAATPHAGASLLTSAATHDAGAALGALVWAVHPLRVEPVAWVTGLPYGLSLAFLLIATIFYLHAHAPEFSAAQQRRAYWLAVAAYALAVLSYPIVLGFVAALLALDFFPLRRFTQPGNAQRVLVEKLPFFALSLLLVAGTVYGRFHVTGTWDKPMTLENFPPFARAMQAFYLWACYLWKTLLPLDLCPVYPVLMESRFTEPVFTLSTIGVLAASLFLGVKQRAWPAAAALWFAHLGLLVPMLGLTERPHYPHDRYSIIDGVLWAIAATAVLSFYVQRRKSSTPILVSGALLVAVLAGLSWRQTARWHSDLPFFTAMNAQLRSPHYRSQTLLKLGNAQADLGDDAQAVASYREALALSPATATFHLHFNLGNALARLAQWREAAVAFNTALTFKPDHAAAHMNYGVALAALNDLPRAAEQLQRAVQLQPDNPDAHAQLAEVLTKQGQTELARQHAETAARLRPPK